MPERAYKSLGKKIEALKYDDHELDFKLKSFIGPTVTWLMLAQVTVMNLAFWLYAALGFAKGSIPSDSVMIAFLTTSTAQIIGLALVVTRYLFPEKGVGWNQGKSS
ncbi:hypothetical protein BRL53_07295 [Corynebacterium ulcerans]|nr:hypothetical protein BRL53_07295 [Corynebacterium ulcerans]